MRAVILAGGKGTRLRPYTVVLPKALMPIGEHPILEVIIRQLVYYGFTHITMAVNHQAEIIQAFFGHGENLKFIPDNRSFGFDHLMHALIKTKNNASVKEHDRYWLDIGRPDGLYAGY